MEIAIFRKSNWKRLMIEIEQGRVVPVVGAELLDVTVEGKGVPLYRHVTRELANRLEVDIPDEQSDMSEVVYAYSCRPGSDPSEPYYEVWNILQELQQVQPPEPLRQLARIEPFDIFLSASCDDFMAKALNEVRFHGESRTLSLSFKKRGTVEDIPPTSASERLDPPVVYHAFGRANTLPMYVVTEEDLLEFGHLWQDEDRRPPRLTAVLRDKYLLMLGCSFQNWLSRFFLCGLKGDALFARQYRQGVVADERTRRDEQLSLFLSRCQTQLYPQGGAREFVAELAHQWQEYTAEARVLPEQPRSDEAAGQMFVKGSFFVSYASEDRAAASHIRQRLKTAGFDVWLDEQRLEAGDQYKRKILRNIEDSSFFLPIISHHVLTPQRRFFRLEWSHAIEEARLRPPEMPFILPLVIDDTPENAPFIPCEFTEVQWQRLPNGEVPDAFLDLCRRRIRERRRQEEAER